MPYGLALQPGRGEPSRTARGGRLMVADGKIDHLLAGAQFDSRELERGLRRCRRLFVQLFAAWPALSLALASNIEPIAQSIGETSGLDREATDAVKAALAACISDALDENIEQSRSRRPLRRLFARNGQPGP